MSNHTVDGIIPQESDEIGISIIYKKYTQTTFLWTEQL